MNGTVAVMFAGCGWMHPFESGAAKFFAEHFDIDHAKLRFGGCSAGAAVAAALSMHINMDDFFETTLELHGDSVFAMCDGVKRVLEKLLMDDEAWRAVTDRLIIGLTAMPWFRPVTISHFYSARHGIDAVRASCHIPILGGVLPYKIDAKNSSYFDGGISMIVPPCDADFTITVDGRPLIGTNMDIVPGFEVPWIWSYMPRSIRMLRALYRLGYLRAAEFVARHTDRLAHVMK